VSDEKPDAATLNLLQRFAEVKRQEAELMSKAEAIVRWVAEARKALGNPFYYGGSRHGREGNAEKSKEKFSGYASHEVGLRFAHDLRAIGRELKTLREELSSIRKALDDAGVNLD
jgi:hypothetical protein